MDDVDGDKSGGDGVRRSSVVAGDLDLCRFYNWPSSRIVRVSRASGGKDRHSKVLTSKGPRDRRVRLSVNTAIQFYDLQDRLGFDQPSKAVEWLLKAAQGSISDLPPIPNNPFPETPKCDEEKRPSCTAGGGNGSSDQLAGEAGDYLLHEGHQNQQQQVAKSCSSASTTETSKGGSGLSLSRSEIRVKARERAKERVLLAEKGNNYKESTCQLVSSISPAAMTTTTSSFTELLSSGMNNSNGSPKSGSNGNNLNESNFFSKSPMQWSTSSTTATAPVDYFAGGLQIGASPPPMFSFTGTDSNHGGGQLQHFSFVSDHHHQLAQQAVNGCNNDHQQQQHIAGTLNFTISNSLSSSAPNASHDGIINRGTLQSNSSSSSSSMFLPPSSLQLPQRFITSTVDHGSPQSFFLAPAMDCNNGSSNINHYQFLSGYDAAARMQLFYGDPTSHHGNNNSSNGGKQSKAKGRRN